VTATGVAQYLSAAVVAALVATVSLPARAEYCRTKACDNHVGYDDVWQTEPDPPCDELPNGCRLQGQLLYWPASCLSFSVQEDGSPKEGIDHDTLHAVVAESFATWMNADCGDGAQPSMRVDDLGSVSCNRLQYNTDQGNANVFMFRDDDWPHPHTTAGDDIALTTITYNRENAQIFDADVEINSFAMDFTVSDDAAETRTDLLAILTHEVGHFFGLSHDDDTNATMFMSYQFPFAQRDLYESDVRGICDIYPPDAPVSTKTCVPRHGYLRTCAVDESNDGCGCSTATANGGTSAGVVALVGLGLSLRRSRARRRRLG
jgi:MYXO-CTERM domain-containing protein